MNGQWHLQTHELVREHRKRMDEMYESQARWLAVAVLAAICLSLIW